MNDLNQRLSREAEQFTVRGGTELDISQVLERAGEIRRGRRMRATMLMAAAVLAVALPVGIATWGANHPTGAKPILPAASNKADDSPIGLGELPRGATPRTGYALAGTLHGPSGPIPLGAGGNLEDLARLGGGFLVARATIEGPGKVVYVADDGTTSATSWAHEGGFATSANGDVGAFLGPGGEVNAVQDGGSIYSGSATLPAGSRYQIDAVGGDGCSGHSFQISCTVYVHSNDANPQVWSVEPEGAVRKALPGFRSLADVTADGLFAGTVSATDNGSCSEVRDGPAAAPLWKTCDYSFLTFSPDGRHLLATQAFRDGAGDGRLVILDARTGDVVLDLATTRDAFLTGQRWEDDTHVLASVTEHGMSAVVRFGLHGDREYATAKAADSEDFISPFRLG